MESQAAEPSKTVYRLTSGSMDQDTSTLIQAIEASLTNLLQAGATVSLHISPSGSPMTQSETTATLKMIWEEMSGKFLSSLEIRKLINEALSVDYNVDPMVELWKLFIREVKNFEP